MQKKFCHLIVGFSIFEYFKNIINSTLTLDNASDIIIVTTGNPHIFGWGGFFDYEFKEDIKIKKYVEEVKIRFKRNNISYFNLNNLRKGNYNKKVGALYDAYNLGFEIAKKNNIDYLNIMQNDSQLMFWSKKIKQSIDEIFTNQDDIFYIFSGFLRKCAHADFYEKYIEREIIFDWNKKKKKIYLNSNDGYGDWGVYDIKKMIKMEFIFKNNENYLSKFYLNKGFYMAISPVPFVGLIPWPVTARKGKINGTVLPLKKKNYLILGDRINEDNLFDNEPAWEEDCIKSNGWWSLKPNWATDINLISLFKSIKKFKLNRGKYPEIYFSNNSKKTKFYPPSLTEPYRPQLFKFLLFYPYNVLIRLIKKIILK